MDVHLGVASARLVPKLWEESVRRETGWVPPGQRVTDTADRNYRLKMTTSQGGAWGRCIFKKLSGCIRVDLETQKKRKNW